MNMVTETKHLDYGDKLVDFYNSIDWGWLFDFVREKYGVGMVQEAAQRRYRNSVGRTQTAASSRCDYKIQSASRHRGAGGFRLPYAFVVTPFFVGMYFRELSRPKQNTYA